MAKCCCTEQNAGIARTDLWILPLAGDRKPRPFLAPPFAETLARFSPNGRWVAYVSNESGRSEVYVVSFPAGAGKRQVSVERRDAAGMAQ
jgi:Tol biopolymer transport system component